MDSLPSSRYFKDGSLVNQVIMAALMTITLTCYGMMLGWMSPAAIILRSNSTLSNRQMQDNLTLGELTHPDLPVSEETISWMASVSPFVAVSGVFVYGYLVDNWGRKRTSMCIMIPFMVCWIIKLSSLRPWALILARVVAGVSSGGTYVVTPVYLREISDDSIRGMLLSFFTLFQIGGYLISYVIGAFLPYTTVLWISLTLPTLQFFIFWTMPESPSYLIKQGKAEEARKTLGWLRNTSPSNNRVIQDVQKMINEQAAVSNAKKVTIISIVRDKTKHRALELAILLPMLTAFSGFFVVAVYAGTIFKKADDGSQFFKVLTPNMQAIFIGSLQLMGSIVATSLVEKCGRKWLLCTSAFVEGWCWAGLAIWFYLLNVGVSIPSWIPVVLLSLAMFISAMGIMSIPFILVVEMFDFQTRATVQVMAEICFNLTAFTAIKSFTPLCDILGMHGVFIIFSVVCWTELAYTVVRAPETKGKSLEQIYEELNPKLRNDKKEMETFVTGEIKNQII